VGGTNQRITNKFHKPTDCLVNQASQAQPVHQDFPDSKESLAFQDFQVC